MGQLIYVQFFSYYYYYYLHPFQHNFSRELFKENAYPLLSMLDITNLMQYLKQTNPKVYNLLLREKYILRK